MKHRLSPFDLKQGDKVLDPVHNVTGVVTSVHENIADYVVAHILWADRTELEIMPLLNDYVKLELSNDT